jgi:hypothetical protein
MSRYWKASNVLAGVAQGSTAAVVSQPIVLMPSKKALSNTAMVVVPGSGAVLDFYSFTAETIATGQAGTSPTITTTIEGTNDFMDLSTTTTGALTAGATTVALTARDGIAQYDFVLLMAIDGSAYEWVQVTSATATGAGNHTIVRAQCGSTAVAFASGAYMFFTRSWTAIPTANATTPTLATAATSISGAAASTPVVTVIDIQQLGMVRMPFPFIRVKTLTGGSATPTATYKVNLSGVLAATDGIRAR